MTTAYYIQDSPFHAHWVRDGEMGPQSSELEVEKDSEEKVKGRDNNSRLAAVKGFLHKLGRNEMQSSHLSLRCKQLVRIAHLCIC